MVIMLLHGAEVKR